MSLNIKLDADGNCNLCNKTSLPNEDVECFMCNSHFHAICSNAKAEDKLANKSTVANFLLNSTKKNFMFLCDICLTNLERITADSDSQRINTLEKQIGGVNEQLLEIKKLLENKESGPVQVKEKSNGQQRKDSIWHNSERLATVKAPPAPSIFVLGKAEDPNTNKSHIDIVEKAIMDNNISLQNTYKNRNGEVVIVCESEESRDLLQNIVSNADRNIPTKTPKGKNPSISIVGAPKEYSADEIIEMLVKQNDFVRNFALANNIDDHFKVFSVRPTKKNPNVFQIFATVSQVLRDGFKQYKDKLTLGLTSCKVYDQYHVKRCYKCQHFGHYGRDCTSQDEYCAKCGDNYATNDCSATIKKCINCVRSESETYDHFTFDSKCPAMLKQQDLLKKKLSRGNLNLTRYKMTQPP